MSDYERDSAKLRLGAETPGPIPAEYQPDSFHLMQNICGFYGVDPANSSKESRAEQFKRPWEVTIYLLHEEFGLTFQEIADQFQYGKVSVVASYRKLQSQIGLNPLLAEEVRYLWEGKPTSPSINERIVDRVAEVTNTDPKDLFDVEESHNSQARKVAMSLIAERGHLSERGIAEFFGLSPFSHSTVKRAKTVIDHQKQSNSLLARQMEWVRQAIFAEEPAPFVPDTSVPLELQEDQEVLLRRPLPDIDESLVHPDIVARVYDIVEQVAEFYNVQPLAIIGREDEFIIRRARRAAALLCQQARVPTAEAAICFDARSIGTFIRLIKTAQTQAEQRKLFAEELGAVAKGETRRDVLAETLQLVSDFYKVRPLEMRVGKGYWPERARAAFMTVMAGHAWTTQKQVSAIIDRSENTAKNITLITRKRMENDPRLTAEIQYLLNPSQVQRPPSVDDIILKVSRSLAIPLAKLRQPESAEERLARRRAAYIMIDELDLPQEETAKILGDTTDHVAWYMKRTRREIANQPERILEIDRLRPPNAISLSATSRVLRHVRVKFKVELVDLSSNDQTPLLNEARALAVQLLIDKAGHSTSEISQILNLPEAIVQKLVQHTT